jgi:hypothetical protein
VVAHFDGGEMSADGGLLLRREVEERIGLADRLAGCLIDTRDPERLDRKMAAILRFRMMMIAGGYEDGNDASSLRCDPVFKMATERLPSEPDLCSQPTISRMENAPDVRALRRMAGALVEQYTGSSTKVPKRIVLHVDDTLAPAAPIAGPTRSTAINSSACSTPTTMATASSRSWYSTIPTGWSPR